MVQNPDYKLCAVARLPPVHPLLPAPPPSSELTVRLRKRMKSASEFGGKVYHHQCP
jgi:hypothetical protein